MMPDTKTVTATYLLFKKEGRSFTLTPTGEGAMRAILPDSIPADAVLSMEYTDEGLRLVVKYEEAAT